MIFTGNYILAEKIDGPANVHDTIEGNILFEINDNVEVETTQTINKLLIVKVYIILPEDVQNKMIPKGTKLYDEKYNFIGKAINDIPYNGYFISKGVQLTSIQGYIHSCNIREESIVENQIEKIINRNNILRLNDFKTHIVSFDYYFDDQFGWTDTYIYYESTIHDPSPGDRVRLFFENNMLIGIIHYRKIDKPKHFKFINKYYSLLVPDYVSDETMNKVIILYDDFLISVD